MWQNPWAEIFSLCILNPCGINEHLALIQLVYFMLPCIYQWHTCSSSASSIKRTQPMVPLFALMKGKAQNITFYLLTEVIWPLTNSFDIYQKVQLEKSSVLHPNPYQKTSSGSCGKNWTWDPQISQTWSLNHITTFTKPLAMLPHLSSLSHAILPFIHANLTT